MLEPHATEMRQELAAARVAALRHSARRSPAGPLRRAVGNGFVRLGLLLGSDGSAPSVREQPSRSAEADPRHRGGPRLRRGTSLKASVAATDPLLSRETASCDRRRHRARARGTVRPPGGRPAQSKRITLRIPSWRSISSKP